MMNVHCVLVHVTYTLGLPPTKAVDPGAVEMKVTRTNLTYLHIHSHMPVPPGAISRANISRASFCV